MPRTRPRILVTRNASQWARAPGAVRGNGFVRKRIKLAGVCAPLDCGVELLRVENLVPGTKPRQLGRGKLRNGFFDVFGSRHPGGIALARDRKKGASCEDARAGSLRYAAGNREIPGSLVTLAPRNDAASSIASLALAVNVAAVLQKARADTIWQPSLSFIATR